MLRLLRKLIAAFEEIDSGPVTLAGTFGKTRLFFYYPSSGLIFVFRALKRDPGTKIGSLQAWLSTRWSGVLSHGATTDGVIMNDE